MNKTEIIAWQNLKISDDEDSVGFPDEIIERIIEHFSNDEKQLVDVLWYNR